MEPRDRIIVALDTKDVGKLAELARQLGPHVGSFKIGLEALMALGPKQSTNAVRGYGPASENVFVDAKLHDIPTTMKGAAEAIMANSNVAFINVHASAGPDGMRAVADVKGRAKLLAVTVLTSIDDVTCERIYGDGTEDTVRRLAALTKGCGVDGIICAPTDVRALRRAYPHMLLVTPGVRPEWADANDQKRIMTPGEAVDAGADYVVIGRPITKPPEKYGPPAAAAKLIAHQIAAYRD